MTTYLYDEFFRADLIDMLHARDDEIASLKEQIEDLKQQARETAYQQEKIDNYRDWEDSISYDRYKDQDLGPVWS